ncbi:MAG: hypothetical protein AAGA37_18000 [Actinomycetota bacterium]
MASRSRTAAGSARKNPARGAPSRTAKRAPRPVEKSRGAARRSSFRSGLTVRAALIALTLVAGGVLAYIPVTDFLDLRGELQDLEDEGDQLRVELDVAERNVRVAESRNAERARCYANYVTPGSESYSIPGSSGCVQ